MAADQGDNHGKRWSRTGKAQGQQAGTSEVTRALVVLAVVLVAHYGYMLDGAASVFKESSWAFYILRGVEGSVIFFLLAKTFSGPWTLLGVFACAFGVYEESQTAICGALAMGEWIEGHTTSGLCLEKFGYLPYAALIASAALIFWGLHGRKI